MYGKGGWGRKSSAFEKIIHNFNGERSDGSWGPTHDQIHSRGKNGDFFCARSWNVVQNVTISGPRPGSQNRHNSDHNVVFIDV